MSTAGGVFIVFEGGDGVGKTTQVDILCAWLANSGHEVVRTFEPGDSAVGAMIRRHRARSGHRGDVPARRGLALCG